MRNTSKIAIAFILGISTMFLSYLTQWDILIFGMLFLQMVFGIVLIFYKKYRAFGIGLLATVLLVVFLVFLMLMALSSLH